MPTKSDQPCTDGSKKRPYDISVSSDGSDSDSSAYDSLPSPHIKPIVKYPRKNPQLSAPSPPSVPARQATLPSDAATRSENSQPTSSSRSDSNVATPPKLVLDFNFDQERAKRWDPVHKYAEKKGVSFKAKDQLHDKLYEPAENVPIFMWPTNAYKLGFKRIGHKEADYLSVLGIDTHDWAHDGGEEGGRSKKRRRGILHAFMYTHPHLNCSACLALHVKCIHVTLYHCPSMPGQDLNEDPPLASSCLRCIKEYKADCSCRGVLLTGPHKWQKCDPEPESFMAWRDEDWDIGSEEKITWRPARTQPMLRKKLVEARKSEGRSDTDSTAEGSLIFPTSSYTKQSRLDPVSLEPPNLTVVDLDKLPLTKSLQALQDWTAKQETRYYEDIQVARKISTQKDDEIRDLRHRLSEAESRAVHCEALHERVVDDYERRFEEARAAAADTVRDLGERVEKAEAAVEAQSSLKARIKELEEQITLVQEESIAARVQGFEAGLRSARGVASG